ELNKPTFRSFVKGPGEYTFSAVHGQFPVREVIQDMQDGKSIFDVINYFDFIGFGQVHTTVNSTLEGQNIAVNQYKFDSKVEITAPTMSNKHMMLVLSLSDVNGMLSPVDLKSINSKGQMGLKTASLGSPYILALMIEKAREGSQDKLPNFDKLSFS